MSDLPLDPGPEEPVSDSVAAGEYALGLLTPEERRAAEVRAGADAAFAAEAAAWTRRLHPLTETLAPVEPPVTLWPRVVKAAGIETPAAAAEAPVAASAQVIAFPARALALWRAGALAATAAAAASIAALVFLVGRPGVTVAPLLTAKLERPAGAQVIAAEPLFTATLDPTRRAVVLAPIGAGPVDPRARELWLIPADGKPRAAGMIDLTATRALPLSPELLRLAQAGAKLAVSLEPEGGAPDGAPTGPVIAAGVLTRL